MREALHDLARSVTAAPGAPAWYGDGSDAVEEWSIASEADAIALCAHAGPAAERRERGPLVRRVVALAVGPTGLDVYRNAAIAARLLAGRARVRVRWSAELGIKAAALALLFGADEIVGPIAPREISRRIAIIGGPPEDPAQPTRSHVEALIRAAGRTPVPLEGGTT